MSNGEIQDWEEACAYISENYVQRVTAFLSGATRNTRVLRNTEFMQIYNLVIYQCDNEDNNAPLYTFYEQQVVQYISTALAPELRNRTGERLLEAYVQSWEKFTIFAKLMEKAFEYLNRYYLKNHCLPLLGELCLNKFKQMLFDGARARITAAICDQISLDRNNSQVNREMIKKAIQTYVYMGLITPKPMQTPQGFAWQGDKNLTVYDEEFEATFLERTVAEYKTKATAWSTNLNCPEYLREVENHLEKETENAEYWLQTESKSKVMALVERELITQQAESVCNKDTGCVYMFENKRLDELKLMFRIFRRDEARFALIIQKMNPYILERGRKIVKDENLQKQPIEFTRMLLAFKQEMDDLLAYSFQNHMKFQKARDNSFQEFMNECMFSATYIAQFADKELREGLKGADDAEVEKRLSAIINLFLCLHGRDAFIKQYQKELASRLLNKSSISQEFEEKMLQKLKMECGVNQVNKMTQMFKDIQLSKDLQAEFCQSNGGSNLVQGVEFNVEVLTQGTWPQTETPPCTLPPALKACSDRFELYYKNKNSQRTITWLFVNGQVELQTLFAEKKYQLIVNVFQAALLALFNEETVLTCAKMKQKSAVSEEKFKDAMMKLCDPKLKLLLKEVNKPVFGETEKIRVNDRFKNNNIRLNLVPQKTTKKRTAQATVEEQN